LFPSVAAYSTEIPVAVLGAKYKWAAARGCCKARELLVGKCRPGSGGILFRAWDRRDRIARFSQAAEASHLARRIAPPRAGNVWCGIPDITAFDRP